MCGLSTCASLLLLLTGLLNLVVKVAVTGALNVCRDGSLPGAERQSLLIDFASRLVTRPFKIKLREEEPYSSSRKRSVD